MMLHLETHPQGSLVETSEAEAETSEVMTPKVAKKEQKRLHREIEMVDAESFTWTGKPSIVEEALPEGWKRRFSAEYEKYYYANDGTGESVWTVSEIGRSKK